MARYLIALGSSHAKGPNYLQKAIQIIENQNYFSIKAKSRIYRNNSLGAPYNRLFYNRVCVGTAQLSPKILYRELMAVEYSLGRIRSHRFARRTMDIDVLFSLDFQYKTTNFFLPHREAFNRNFFVIPAIEALKLADWPLPFKLLEARSKLGKGYLYPLSS